MYEDQMHEEYQDKELVCICGEPFTWTKGEQRFLQSLLDAGKMETIKTPRRCKGCRVKNKQAKDAREKREPNY